MKILLVEDRAADALQISEIFRQLGHSVTVAQNGETALDHYIKQHPDVVATGAFVPGIDGFALTRAIQKLAAPRWQPVIFISGECDEELQARALEVGGDAFFVKPVMAHSLAARLDVIGRLLKMQQDAEAHLAQISRYLAAEEEDLRIARHLIEHQLAGDNPRRLDDPAVQYWHLPCSGLGGDMLSFSRAPNGVLHVMLADASGSGLVAYVSLLPIIAPFYRMTEKGFPLATIVRELNLKVRQALPTNRVVAAQLAAIDTREGIVSIWNGDMPTAFMLDGFGHHFREFTIAHAPLGAVDDTLFDDRIEQHAFTRGEQLVMVSDGLLEAVGPSGTCFGEQGLADALVGLPRSQRLAEASAALSAHLDNQAPGDDLSLVLIDCEKEGVSLQASPPRAPRERHPGSWRFSLDLGANELGHLDVVPLLLNVASQFQISQERSGELFVILSELFNNALDHGVLRLDSRLKLSPDGMESWLQKREECLMALVAGEIKLSVEQLVESGRAWLRIHCRDSGPGFDVHATLHATNMQRSDAVSATMPSLLPFGRGLALVQQMAHCLDFNETGNEVTVLLALEEAPLPGRVT